MRSGATIRSGLTLDARGEDCLLCLATQEQYLSVSTLFEVSLRTLLNMIGS